MNQMMEAWKQVFKSIKCLRQGTKILDERWISLKHNAKLSLSFFRLVKNKRRRGPSLFGLLSLPSSSQQGP
ncbi:unnamed protein product [Brassica rapa]|uniref:Uncharacterized protein n=1 Tax=Brassica campestris TaxID=3711 RepID=A0A8D9G8H9_BRACM|nr:unnamed protein product [Brassica rapa]